MCSWGDTAEPEKTYAIYCNVVESGNQHIFAVKIDDCIERLDTGTGLCFCFLMLPIT